jgi:hypothetical protein
MSFHVGGHKPQPPQKRVELTVRRRFVVGGIGVFLTICGLYPFKNGQFVGEDWYKKTMYLYSFATVGVVSVLLALIPGSWLERLSKRVSR